MERTEYIITPEELKTTGRPIGGVDSKQLLAYIIEAEQMLVKPTLGTTIFMTLKTKIAEIDEAVEGDELFVYKTLLHGGTYFDADEESHCFLGLHAAMAYYIYAQNIMVGDFQSTRYGMVVKNDDYSQHLTAKERSDAYNNALEVANNYMQECVDYCISTGLIETKGRSRLSGSVTIKKIG